MQDNMFDDLDPWERIMVMQARIEQLESINNEIVVYIKNNQRHMESIGKAINQLQIDYVDLVRQSYTVNKNGEHE